MSNDVLTSCGCVLRLDTFTTWMDSVDGSVKELEIHTMSSQEYKDTIEKFQVRIHCGACFHTPSSDHSAKGKSSSLRLKFVVCEICAVGLIKDCKPLLKSLKELTLNIRSGNLQKCE